MAKAMPDTHNDFLWPDLPEHGQFSLKHLGFHVQLLNNQMKQNNRVKSQHFSLLLRTREPCEA